MSKFFVGRVIPVSKGNVHPKVMKDVLLEVSEDAVVVVLDKKK